LAAAMKSLGKLSLTKVSVDEKNELVELFCFRFIAIYYCY